MYQQSSRRRLSRKTVSLIVVGAVIAFGSLSSVAAHAAYVPNGCKAGQASYKAYSGATRSCAQWTGSKAGTGKATSAGVKKTSGSKSTGGASGASNSTWDKLAQCESGGNWGINTGNGYQGGLQFSPSTWKAHGGSGSAANASKAEQIRVAKNVQANQGWGAWPACSKKLGLR